MAEILDAIFQRRAVKVFEPVEISDALRERILDAARHAPSSFNLQPYKFFWVRTAVARLCLGQKPEQTASALVVAVADIGALSATSRCQLEWMRGSNFTQEEIRDYERKAKIGRVLFVPGPFGLFAAIKRVIFWMLNLRMVVGMPPLSRQELFKWATRSTALACQNKPSQLRSTNSWRLAQRRQGGTAQHSRAIPAFSGVLVRIPWRPSSMRQALTAMGRRPRLVG